MENITVRIGPQFSTEIVLPGSTALILLCNRRPFVSWLRNGSIEARSSPILNIRSEGIYQCLSELSLIPQDGTDGTDFTGEPGSNVYILTQGTL